MAANPTIQLKRKVTSGAPASLAIGEPAVNTADNQLYVGVNSSGVKWVGAEIENSSTNGTTWSSDLKLATKKAIGDYFAAKSGTTFTGDITLSGGSDIRFVETGGGTDYVAIQAPSVVSTGNVTLTLPGSYAAADGYVLSSTTGGTLSWISAGTASSVSVTETSTNSAFNLLFTSATSTTSASLFIDTDDKITFNPSTNILAVTGTLNVDGLSIAQTTTSDYQITNASDDNTLTIYQSATADAASIVLDTTTGQGVVTITAVSTVVTGDLAVNGADITTTATGTATLFNTNATTVNVGGAATNMTLGSTSGTITARGGTLVGNTTTQNLFNTTATTLNVGGAATTVSIGAATGTTTINNANTVVTGDLAVNGSDITTTGTGTATLFNTNALTVNMGGAATAVSIGAATGTATINNANTVVTGDLAVNGGDITSTTTGTFNFLVSNPTIYLGTSSGTDIRVGKTDNTGTVRVYGDLNVAKGSITTAASTASIFDATATTITMGAASTSTTIGSSVSGTTILNSPTVRGASTSQALYDTVATTMNFAGAATTLNIGHDGAAASSTTNIVVGEVGNLQTKTINIGTGATDGGTAINLGSTSGSATTTVTVNGSLIATTGFSTSGDVAVNGGDLTTTVTGTATLFNSNATTVNIGGAATTMTLGASTATINLGGGTTGATVVIKGNLQVDGSTTTINSTTLTVDDKLIELAHSPSGAVGNDAAVDGGGIQLNSSQGNKTFTWVDSTDAWTSSEHLNLASGKAYYINGTSVLNATTLGSTITGSSLTQVGTVTLGTWNGTTIGVGYGGTGLTTYTTGQILYASAASTLAGLTASSTAGAVVSSTGAGAAPEYKVISVTNGSVTSGSGTLTLAIQDASADGSTKGLATFNATQFDSASGVITLDTIDGGTYA